MPRAVAGESTSGTTATSGVASTAPSPRALAARCRSAARLGTRAMRRVESVVSLTTASAERSRP